MSEPKINQVFILKRGDRAIVWPPYLAVKGNEYIRFIALGVSAKIEFPLDMPFEANGSTHSPTAEKPAWSGVENAQGGTEAILRLKEDAPVMLKLTDQESARTELRNDDGLFARSADKMLSGETQIYSYSVFCPEINDFAEGNSSPVIMIEPPERPPGP
jgi:hypothetical protein